MSEHSPFDLADMSEAEARAAGVDMDRWRSVRRTFETMDQAEATWTQEERAVGDTVVKAAHGDLTIPLTIYGNDVEVRAEYDRETIELFIDLEERSRGRGVEFTRMDPEQLKDAEDMMRDVFTSIVVSFDGTPIEETVEHGFVDWLRSLTPWYALTDPADALFETCLDAWGLTGMAKALYDIRQAIEGHHEAWEDLAKSFRRQERARTMRGAAGHGAQDGE